MRSFLLLGLFLFSSAHAASECKIKEIRKVKGYFLTFSNLKSEVATTSLDECIDSAKELLGREVTGTYTYRRISGRQHHRSRRVVDNHAVFLTSKVILRYRGDETQGETVIVKFK